MRLGSAAAFESFDLVSLIAEPLPLDIAFTMLGVPFGDRERVGSWARAFKSWQLASDEAGVRKAEVETTLDQFDSFAIALADRDAAESTALSSSLALAKERGELSGEEYLAYLMLLVVNGLDTLTSSISVAAYELLRPGSEVGGSVLAEVGAQRFFEEVLRFHSPVRFTSRIACEDIDVPGGRIRADRPVVFFLAAANRDPRQFSQPDRFDPTRPPTRHVAFGSGAHRCLGRHVAALAGTVVLQELDAMAPRPHFGVPEGDLRWSDSVLYRSLEELELAVS